VEDNRSDRNINKSIELDTRYMPNQSKLIRMIGAAGSLILLILFLTTLMQLASLAPYLRTAAPSIPESLVERIVNRPDYAVHYTAKLPFDNDTDLIVRVKLNGTPVDFGMYVTAPAPKGFVEVGRTRGGGKAKISIGHYLGEAVRLVRELGYTPNQAGPSLILHITTSWKEGNETYVGTQIITVPVIPGKVSGRDIVVDVNFKPHRRHKINGSAVSISQAAASHNVATATASSSLPDPVTDYCVWIDPGLPSWKLVCYIWRYSYTQYDGWDGIMFATTHLDSIDGEVIKQVTHDVDIAIYANKAIGFELGVETQLGYLNLPGPGFTIAAGNSNWNIFKMNCVYTNSFFTSSPGTCSIYIAKDGTTRSWDLPTFYKDVILATGTYGMYKIGVYDYLECSCPTSDGFSCTTVAFYCTKKSTDRLHWVAPQLNPDTQTWYPYTIIDDNLAQYWNKWLLISGQKYDTVATRMLSPGQSLTDLQAGMYYTSENVKFFALSFPLLVFGLGVEFGTSSTQFGYASVTHTVQAGACGTVELRRYYAPQIYLEPSVSITWAKGELIQPVTAAYWPYSTKCP